MSRSLACAAALATTLPLLSAATEVQCLRGLTSEVQQATDAEAVRQDASPASPTGAASRDPGRDISVRQAHPPLPIGPTFARTYRRAKPWQSTAHRPRMNTRMRTRTH